MKYLSQSLSAAVVAAMSIPALAQDTMEEVVVTATKRSASTQDIAVAVQALGEDMVFGVRFMDNPHPRSWVDLLDSDRELGTRWAMECVRRGALILPNEKIYLSVAHAEADVDRALEICDAAFAACTR